MFEISREYWFSAAHWLTDHPKCGKVHGHNYRVVVTVARLGGLDADGMVVDYARLDEIVKPVVDRLDHRLLISKGQSLLIDVPQDNVYFVPEVATTGELIAKHLHEQIRDMLPPAYGITEVEVWETNKSMARYRPL